MAFKVGEKVICVNDTPKAFNAPGKIYFDCPLGGLTKGEVYTIEKVGNSPYDNLDIVWVKEIVRHTDNPWYIERHGRSDASFAAARFRPLVETNIDIFQAMLVNPHREVEVCE